MNRKKGILFSYVLLFVEMLTSLLFTPFLIRSLGQAEFGLYSIVGSITAYLLLLDLGVGNAVVRYMAKFRIQNDVAQQKNFLAVVTIFYFLIGILVIISGFYISNKVPVFFSNSLTLLELSKVRAMLSITMLNAAISLIIAPYDKTIIAYEKFAFSKSLAILKTLLRVFISSFVLYHGGDSISIVTVNLALTLLSSGLTLLYVIVELGVVPKVNGVRFEFLSEILGYSFFIFVQMIATQINSMVDKVLLGALTSSIVVGIYAVGSQITNYFESIAGSINGVLMPGIVRLVENNAKPKELQEEMTRIGRIVFLLLGIIWVTFLVNGQLFITLWAGQQNVAGFWVSLLIMFPMTISFSQVIGTQILWAKGKHKVQAILKIFVSITNIILTIYLIKWNPIIGASIGTAVALIFGDIIVMNIVFTKFLSFKMIDYYKDLFDKILPTLVMTLIFGFIIKPFNSQNWSGLFVGCLSMVTFYSLVLWFFALNKYEKSLFLSIFSRVLR